LRVTPAFAGFDPIVLVLLVSEIHIGLLQFFSNSSYCFGPIPMKLRQVRSSRDDQLIAGDLQLFFSEDGFTFQCECWFVHYPALFAYHLPGCVCLQD